MTIASSKATIYFPSLSNPRLGIGSGQSGLSRSNATSASESATVWTPTPDRSYDDDESEFSSNGSDYEPPKVPYAMAAVPFQKPGTNTGVKNKNERGLNVVPPLTIPMNRTFDPGFTELVNRVGHMKCAFGMNDVDHFCVQVKDYVTGLIKREKCRLEYKGTSPQRAGRPKIIYLLMEVAENDRLTRNTLHLAVYLYDRFSDFHDIPGQQLTLVALCCLIIAGKLEERDLDTPKMKFLRSYLPQSSCSTFSFTLYVELEKFILYYFDWVILIPTAYTFLEFFLLFVIEGSEKRMGSGFPNQSSVTYETNNNNIVHNSSTPQVKSVTENSHTHRHKDDDQAVAANADHKDGNGYDGVGVGEDDDGEIDGSWNRITDAVRAFAIEVVDVLLQDEPNDRFPPSQVAASAIMYSRRSHGFSEWSERLELITSYARVPTLFCCEEYVRKIYESHTKCGCREASSSSTH